MSTAAALRPPVDARRARLRVWQALILALLLLRQSRRAETSEAEFEGSERASQPSR